VNRPLRIGVIGEQDASPALVAAAEEVGREVARRGGVVVCGGMGGVMAGAARGAAREGGVVVGILPGSTADGCSPDVTIPIVTGMGEGRNVLIARTAEAVIAIGGAYGTLSEIAYALKMGVPVVGYETWVMQRAGIEADPIRRVDRPIEAVALAWKAAAERRRALEGIVSHEARSPRGRREEP